MLAFSTMKNVHYVVTGVLLSSLLVRGKKKSRSISNSSITAGKIEGRITLCWLLKGVFQTTSTSVCSSNFLDKMGDFNTSSKSAQAVVNVGVLKLTARYWWAPQIS
jgi:hypothetical protein